MHKLKASTHSPLPNTIEPSTSALFINLRLLNLDQCDDWPQTSAQNFSDQGDFPTQKTRIQFVEWILYRLWQKWDQEECCSKLQPFFPPLEPLQSLNLRAALFRCLNDLRKKGTLGKDITIRKSMFDDCNGQIVSNLLSAFSTVVIQKVLISGGTGKSSIVGRMCVSNPSRPDNYLSMRPLIIAHQMSLRELLSRKRTLKARYREFTHTLDTKDSNLAGKFEKVVEIQNFLDKNPPSETTVERVSRVLDQHWAGDHELVEVIAQGEEHGLKDALLDHRFDTVWSNVGSGKFDKNTSLSHHGLLEDLEKRVALQKARLAKWKECQGDLKQRQRPRDDKITDSPVKHTFGSPQSHNYEQRGGKALVFSPRKSPRKSIGPIRRSTEVASSASPKLPGTTMNSAYSTAILASDLSTGVITSPLPAKSAKLTESIDRSSLCNSSASEGEDHNSDFSEETIGVGTIQQKQDRTAQLERPNDLCDPSLDKPKMRNISWNGSRQLEKTDSIEAVTISMLKNDGIDDKMVQEKPTMGDFLVERLISSGANAGPTPKPNFSLTERTRQSMAYASPERDMPREVPSPSIPLSIKQPKPALPDTSVKATLAERTRQSISLVPTKPKYSNDSMHARRTSKIYPTNQFETPRRQTVKQKMTPPEELMSPGAGYDSVFKSRPKIALSPATSPKPELKMGLGIEIAMDDVGSLEDSPLARTTLKI